MAIDISNRPGGPMRKVELPHKRSSGLSADVLKLIAVAAMLIDHIAWAFVPFNSFAGQAMHIIGRITAPIMCFMLAEGYHKTRNVKKYAARLGAFAVISHFAYVYFETGSFDLIHSTSVIFTLFLGLMALIVRDAPKLSSNAKNGIILVICVISMVGDWMAIAVGWILIFSAYRYDRRLQIKYFCIFSLIVFFADIVFCAMKGVWYNDLMQFGVFLFVPLIMKYNGLRRSGNVGKWFFYIFYPAHLFIIALIKYVII